MSSAHRRVSESFLSVAARPLEQAAAAIAENRIVPALEALSAARLAEAYRGGARAVATLAGVSPSDVERLLPMAEASASLGRIAELVPRAAEVWRAHAGELGFFDLVTELTVDGTAPDVAILLERVSKKLSRDRALSTPLAELALELGRYTDLVTASAERLAGGDWVATALRRKKLRTVLAAAVPTALIVVLTALIVVVRVRRSALDTVLSGSDACAAAMPGEALERYASREQRAKLDERRAECARAAARRAEEAEAAAAKWKAEAEAKLRAEALTRRCTKLASALGSQAALDPELARELGPEAALVERIRAKKLDPADVGPAPVVLPCEGTDARAAVERAFADALLGDVSVWTVRGDPSPLVHGVLVMHAEEVPERARLGLAGHAERTAKHGLVRGEPATLARAKRLCALARALGTPGRSACDAVERGD